VKSYTIPDHVPSVKDFMVPTANGEPHAAGARIDGEPEILSYLQNGTGWRLGCSPGVRPAQGARECGILFGHEHLLLRTRRRLPNDPARTPVTWRSLFNARPDRSVLLPVSKVANCGYDRAASNNPFPTSMAGLNRLRTMPPIYFTYSPPPPQPAQDHAPYPDPSQ